MPKIYLSPAAHGSDNPCSYSKTCGENKHCNLYMDELERYLKHQGVFEVKRAPKSNTGNKVSDTIKESNAWKANIHHVAHTNAGGGKAKGSRPMVSIKGGMADKLSDCINARLKGVYPYDLRAAVVDNRWSEIINTTASCLYEEMVFHDNTDDVKWFHKNYKQRAKLVAMAYCDLYKIQFKDPDVVSQPVQTTPTQPTTTPQTTQMYRVRKSWGDAKSQIGAFSVLNNAKALADSRASEGYRVFDNDGKVVYTPVQPAPSPTPTPTPTNPTTPSVPEPAQEPVVIEKHSILGTSETTAEQMATYVLKHNQNPQIAVDIYDLAEMYLQEASIEGVRGDIAFAQSIHETGYFKYGGDVKPEQNNYSGIGATGGGVAGATFESPTVGVRAQIQHLKAYASKNGLQQDCVDPRYNLVTKGIAPNLEDLAGRWAVPGYNKTKYDSLDDALVAGETYGQYIWDTVVAIKNTVGIPKPIQESEDPVIEESIEPDEPISENPVKPVEDEAIPKVSFLRLIVDTIIKIIKLIMHK